MKRVLFVYTCLIDACTKCVYDSLEFALGIFLFIGGHGFEEM